MPISVQRCSHCIAFLDSSVICGKMLTVLPLSIFKERYVIFCSQLEAVKEHGSQLMAAKHFEMPKVEQTLHAIVSR